MVSRPRPKTTHAKKIHAAVIAEHAASILAIPDDQLPDADARAALVRRAQAGDEVYAYRPFGSPNFVLWVRPEHAWQDGRWQPSEYARCWGAYRASNVASISTVPLTLLPDGPARQALLDSAARGDDTYCFVFGGTPPSGVPSCWYRRRRYALAEWPAVYDALHAEKGGAR